MRGNEARASNMQGVVIFGIGRGAEVATRYFRDDSPYEVLAYTVDDAFSERTEFMGRPVVPFSRVETELPPTQCRMFIPLGFQRMNALRADKFEEARSKRYSFVNYVSSRISAWELPKMGENCFILEGNIFNYDVTIGDDVVLWSGNHIGDFCAIEDHAWISSGAVLSGDVRIGARSFLGVNATVSNHVRIGPRCYIGASTLITQDTPQDSVYVTKGTSKIERIDSLRFLGTIKN
jgi:sugar O-acyltransferase (sialic acid O-acetyltransferase NeuD family)